MNRNGRKLTFLIRPNQDGAMISVAVDSGVSLEAVGILGLDPFVADMGIVLASLGVPAADGGTGVPAGSRVEIEADRDTIMKYHVGFWFRSRKARSRPGRRRSKSSFESVGVWFRNLIRARDGTTVTRRGEYIFEAVYLFIKVQDKIFPDRASSIFT